QTLLFIDAHRLRGQKSDTVAVRRPGKRSNRRAEMSEAARVIPWLLDQVNLCSLISSAPREKCELRAVRGPLRVCVGTRTVCVPHLRVPVCQPNFRIRRLLGLLDWQRLIDSVSDCGSVRLDGDALQGSQGYDVTSGKNPWRAVDRRHRNPA